MQSSPERVRGGPRKTFGAAQSSRRALSDGDTLRPAWASPESIRGQLHLRAHPLETGGESLDLLLLLSQSQLEALSLFGHCGLKLGNGRLLSRSRGL